MIYMWGNYMKNYLMATNKFVWHHAMNNIDSSWKPVFFREELNNTFESDQNWFQLTDFSWIIILNRSVFKSKSTWALTNQRFFLVKSGCDLQVLLLVTGVKQSKPLVLWIQPRVRSWSNKCSPLPSLYKGRYRRWGLLFYGLFVWLGTGCHAKHETHFFALYFPIPDINL